MKQITKLFVLLAAVASLNGCRYVKVSKETRQEYADVKSGLNLKTKTLELPDFCNIDMAMASELKFTQGESTSVQIVAPEAYIDNILAYVDGNTLIVNSKKKAFILGMRDVKFYITSPEIKQLTFSGAVDFSTDGPVCTDYFNLCCNGAAEVEIDQLTAGGVELEVNGAGDIEIDRIDAKTLYININGAGDCTISGKADNVDVSMNGAGDVDITGLQVQTLSSSVNGAGKISRPR